MKSILIQFIITLIFIPAFAQTYNTACEVPDILKEGYMGRVKKVTRETYDTKNINGKLVNDKLTELKIDTCDIKGYLRKTENPLSHSFTAYEYDNTNKLLSGTYYKAGHTEGKKQLRCIDKYSYEWISYNYDKGQKKFSKTAWNKDTIVLSDNFLLNGWVM